MLPHGKRLPIRRVIHFAALTKDPIRFSLFYNTSTPTGLPPGALTPELATFEVTGIDNVISK